MPALSPKMKAALARLEDGEQPVNEIGRSTVAALMNRGMVEVDEAGDVVSLPAHKHAWERTMHIDGCHWFASSFECSCGAQAGTTTERTVRADPYSAVWMDDPAGCERCSELLAGARAKHSVTIVRPGTAPAIPRIGRAS
jgi:hypothetical protein